MFALPSSILTWSFVAEAERMAKLAYTQSKRENTRGSTQVMTTTKGEQFDDEDLSDETDSYSTDEEYLKILSGYEEQEDAKPKLLSKSENDNTRQASVLSQNQSMKNASDTDEELTAKVTRIEKTVKEQTINTCQHTQAYNQSINLHFGRGIPRPRG